MNTINLNEDQFDIIIDLSESLLEDLCFENDYLTVRMSNVDLIVDKNDFDIPDIGSSYNNWLSEKYSGANEKISNFKTVTFTEKVEISFYRPILMYKGNQRHFKSELEKVYTVTDNNKVKDSSYCYVIGIQMKDCCFDEVEVYSSKPLFFSYCKEKLKECIEK